MTNSVGDKVKELRDHFNMSQKQATALIGDISHSTWAYWETHGCPVEKLADIAKLTTDAKVTFDWLTTVGAAKPELELIKPIPANGTKRSPKKVGKKKVSRRRTFTNQDRANILVELDRCVKDGETIVNFARRHRLGTSNLARWRKKKLPKPNNSPVPGIVAGGVTGTATGGSKPRAGSAERDKAGRRVFTHVDRSNILQHWQQSKNADPQLTFGNYCEGINVAHSVIRRWMTMELPAPTGEAVPGVIPSFEVTKPQSAVQHTNLPQEPAPLPAKPGPKAGTRVKRHYTTPTRIPKVKSLIVASFFCPHCGGPVQLPEE